MIKKYIEVHLDVEAVHNWPNCDIPEVIYLLQEHRHTFKIACRKEVTHGDRDIEFIKFKHTIQDYIYAMWWSGLYRCHDFGSMSCEQIATKLLEQFKLCRCSVSEDGEFFGIVTID